MNGQNLAPPDFENMTWKCPCCEQQRKDKYIKVVHHDVSQLFEMETGAIIINCRYCVDMEQCQKKAFDREWIIDHFFKAFIKNDHKIDVSQSGKAGVQS
jgi:ubiquitin C-terminal hydrolase